MNGEGVDTESKMTCKTSAADLPMRTAILSTVSIIVVIVSLLFIFPVEPYRSLDVPVSRRLSRHDDIRFRSGISGFLTTYTPRVTAVNDGKHLSYSVLLNAKVFLSYCYLDGNSAILYRQLIDCRPEAGPLAGFKLVYANPRPRKNYISFSYSW